MVVEIACKDSEVGEGVWGRRTHLCENLVFRAGDWLDVGDFRFLGRCAEVSRAMWEG